ncbi:MAG: hypothetical protein EA377_09060 [Phycisphaerales bacterium]|nr:MAG: hypothetical protein EA377_09060 [Phycisphaerales bacterium]
MIEANRPIGGEASPPIGDDRNSRRVADQAAIARHLIAVGHADGSSRFFHTRFDRFPQGVDLRREARPLTTQDSKMTSRKFHMVHSAWSVAVSLAVLGLLSTAAFAQNGRPAPRDASPTVVESNDDREASRETARDRNRARPRDREREADSDNGPNRRPGRSNDMVKLAFNDVGVDEVIPFIVETTGKVVMPVNVQILRGRRITIVNDEWISRDQALDLLFTAFRLNGVGVIEKEDVIIIDQLDTIITNVDLPVFDATQDILHRTDRGTIIIKMFQIENANAEGIGERVAEVIPDYARLSIDANSNQIIVMGDIGLCQQVQRLISELDYNYVSVETKTFRLAYADANEVADNIFDLFDGGGATVIMPGAQPRQQRGRTQAQRGQAQQQASSTPVATGPIVEMRLTVNIAQNTVTVQSDPEMIEQVSTLIDHHWDLPRPTGSAKVYTLEHTDPLKMRDLLRELLTGTGGGGAAGGGRQAARQAGGGGGRSDVAQTIGGIYRIDAYPDSNQLVVLSKTEDNLDFLDHVVESLDQPSTVGMPVVVELKHANAVSLTEELNALLSEAGSGVTLPRPPRGLTAEGIGSAAEGGGGRIGGEDGQRADIQFPWQAGRQPEGQAPESSLVGRVRVVPIVRQNAIAVLAPPAHRDAVIDLIEYFDRPGRQVMISAVIAEVVLTDELSFGLRLSNSDTILGGGNPDFRIGGGLGVDTTRDDIFGSAFTASVLDFNFSVNLALQALAQKTNVRILQEPRVFTADNQEAVFFDGQDIPFITNTVITDIGTVNESFEYRAVGVQLNVRPRITVERDVDLEINLELSSIVPGQTLFGGFIIDRRTTQTNIIVKNGQTIVLSGILKDSESKITRKVPLLGDIPLIGEIFTSRENQQTTTELIAFITPIVVDNPSENEENFNVSERENLRRLARPMAEQAKETQNIRDRIVDPRTLIKPSPSLEEALNNHQDQQDESARPEPAPVPEEDPFDPIQSE